ncbi:MAG: F0F1 ATP synthase subunit B [Candidatus Cloacimonetes bacterium]|nr:F0F1 ATP synthase subunit B [Candidatus Cloacimonadota bacterium]
MYIDFLLLATILNFILLMIILNRLLYKPLKKYFNDRQNKIKEDLAEAERQNKIANDRVTEKNEELSNFRAGCKEIKEKIIKDAEAEREVILMAAKDKEQDLIKHAENKIMTINKKAIDDLEDRISEVIATLTGKILEEKIDSEKDKELIMKLLAKRG